FPLGINAVHLKQVLGEIKTDRGNVTHRAAPIPCGCETPQPWHNRCRRVGAVHRITSGHDKILSMICELGPGYPWHHAQPSLVAS
ncbi:MAG: hypothetical protein R3229_15390, partial [Alphaproteobacteria bacterium]|nr:hypothetical protein [Alphaproteobacteria bacterium]